MFKRMVMILFLLSFGMGGIQAQDTICDLETADEFIQRGVDAFYAYDYDSAIANYNCALELDPENFYANYNLGSVYYFRGEYDTSIEYFTAAHEANPTDIETLQYRSDVYYEQGLYEESLEDVNLILELDVEYPSAYLRRAWIYLSLEQEDAMHEDFLMWIRMNEENAFELNLADVIEYQNLPIEFGQSYYISVEGEAEQKLSVAASSRDNIDPLVVLLAPDGSAIASDDDGGSNLNSVISRFELPETGSYTIVIGQAGGYGTGNIELSVILDSSLVSTNGTNTGDVRSDFSEYNLFVEDTAEIFTTGGDCLNLRAEPNTEADILDCLEYGELVTLLEGPRKEGGYSWWYIRNDEGIEGWSVERVEVEQTLQLALLTGEDAFVVTLEEVLNVRATPDRGGELLFQLADGERVTLLEDVPVVVDGLRWWHIRDSQGREGWAVDRLGRDRTLAPVREFPNR